MYWKPVGYFTPWGAFSSQDHGVTYLGNWCDDDTKLISRQEWDQAMAYSPILVHTNQACSWTGKAHFDDTTGSLTLHALNSNDSGYWEYSVARQPADYIHEYALLEVYGKQSGI